MVPSWEIKDCEDCALIDPETGFSASCTSPSASKSNFISATEGASIFSRSPCRRSVMRAGSRAVSAFAKSGSCRFNRSGRARYFCKSATPSVESRGGAEVTRTAHGSFFISSANRAVISSRSSVPDSSRTPKMSWRALVNSRSEIFRERTESNLPGSISRISELKCKANIIMPRHTMTVRATSEKTRGRRCVTKCAMVRLKLMRVGY